MRLKFSLSAAASVALVLTLGGCMPAQQEPPTDSGPTEVTGEELYANAKARYAPYKFRVNDAQRQVFDGEWQITTYGDFPELCQGETGQLDDTHRFVTSVHLAEPARVIGDDLRASMGELADQLESDGWQDVTLEDVGTEGAESFTVSARDLTQHVDLLVINFHGGFDGGNPWVKLEASSDCGEGSSLDLMDEMFPADVELPDEPTTMVPDGPVRFGFDETGEAVMLDGPGE